jgi:hypothetical protein
MEGTARHRCLTRTTLATFTALAHNTNLQRTRPCMSTLRKHARCTHPSARPSEIDRSRLDRWMQLERQRELGDILSMMPGATVLGDYEIEGDENGDDEDEDDTDFPGDDGNWWTVFLLFQVFGQASMAGGRGYQPALRTSPWSSSSSPADFAVTVKEISTPDTTLSKPWKTAARCALVPPLTQKCSFLHHSSVQRFPDPSPATSPPVPRRTPPSSPASPLATRPAEPTAAVSRAPLSATLKPSQRTHQS